MNERTGGRSAVAAGVVLGMGFGAFIDGILLHMILQWHNMVSTWIPPTSMAAMRINMRWDGIFETLALFLTVAGVALLWGAAQQRAALPPTVAFVGLMILGAGVFNLIEGPIDHHLLGIHHVREVANPLPWDVGFLLFGGVLPVAIGWFLMRAGRRAPQVSAGVVRS